SFTNQGCELVSGSVHLSRLGVSVKRVLSVFGTRPEAIRMTPLVHLPDGYRFPPIVQRGSTLWYMLLVNFALPLLRVLQRADCVWRLRVMGYSTVGAAAVALVMAAPVPAAEVSPP